jgi:glycosyltransferase involved in cell wall biosynthesis
MSNRIAQELEVLDLDGILVCSIPNGAQTFPELVRHPRPDGPLRIIAVGRLVRQKGLDILLSAVRKTTDLGCDVSVRIVGDGPLLGDLSSLSYELRLTDRVTFVGEVLPDKIYEEFANADLFVLCSR